MVDWPNSFGYNMFLYPLSRMTGGIYYEHAHRLVAEHERHADIRTRWQSPGAYDLVRPGSSRIKRIRQVKCLASLDHMATQAGMSADVARTMLIILPLIVEQRMMNQPGHGIVCGDIESIHGQHPATLFQEGPHYLVQVQP